MKKNRTAPLSVPVTGVSERYLTMEEIMHCGDVCKRRKDWEDALMIYIYGAECSYLPAKLELARLLRGTPQLSMPQAERYAKCEELYHQVLAEDLSPRAEGTLYKELADFYDMLNRPVAYLGAMLRAKRLGYPIPDQELELCRRRLQRLDVNNCGSAGDCYLLGSELLSSGMLKMAELFLRESCETPDQALAGQAHLDLAELYHRQGMLAEASIHLSTAANLGNPDILAPA